MLSLGALECRSNVIQEPEPNQRLPMSSRFQSRCSYESDLDGTKNRKQDADRAAISESPCLLESAQPWNMICTSWTTRYHRGGLPDVFSECEERIGKSDIRNQDGDNRHHRCADKGRRVSASVIRIRSECWRLVNDPRTAHPQFLNSDRDHLSKGRTEDAISVLGNALSAETRDIAKWNPVAVGGRRMGTITKTAREWPRTHV
jgi:hypothetical protein